MLLLFSIFSSLHSPPPCPARGSLLSRSRSPLGYLSSATKITDEAISSPSTGIAARWSYFSMVENASGNLFCPSLFTEIVGEAIPLSLGPSRIASRNLLFFSSVDRSCAISSALHYSKPNDQEVKYSFSLPSLLSIKVNDRILIYDVSW